MQRPGSSPAVRAALAASGALVCLCALATLCWVAVRTSPHPPTGRREVAVLLGMWVVFAIGAWLVMRAPRRFAVGLALTGAVLLQVIALTAPPALSDDVHRYAWDGRVQAAGVNPYLYAPGDPRLESLRDPVLFPPGRTCAEVQGTCPVINRPDVTTIYPPAAQVAFLAVHVVAGGDPGPRPRQMLAAGLALLTLAVILAVLMRRGSDPRRAVLWAWCPLAAVELGNNAHIDGLAVLLVVTGLALLSRPALSRAGALMGGVALGLAIATKYWPAAVVPATLRRRPGAVLVGAAIASLCVYLPYLATGGTAVLGYAPGYVAEESAGSFAVLRLLLPQSLAVAVGIAILVAAAGWAYLRADPLAPWTSAAMLVGVGLIVITPAYQWYALALPALAALGARAVWLVLAPAMTVSYLLIGLQIDSVVPLTFETMRGILYLAAAMLVVLVSLSMRRRGAGPTVAVTLPTRQSEGAGR